MRKLSTSEFIQRAEKVHGSVYDYSGSIYAASHQKIAIVCQTHGVFFQRPNDHVGKKQGCPKCGKQSAGVVRRKGRDRFIEEARMVHGDVYEYDKVQYANTHSKVIITCFVHGDFVQTPNCHLSQKNGCPDCGKCSHPGRYTLDFFERGDNKSITGFFYVVEFSFQNERFIKIGITTTDLKKRFYGRQGPYCMNIICVSSLPLYRAFLKEQKILQEQTELRYRPKHQLEGHTECFTLDILHRI